MEPSDTVIDGLHAVWQVQVISGAMDIDIATAPVIFGVPAVTLTPDGEVSDPRTPLLYGPVEVYSILPESLVIRTTRFEPHAGAPGLYGTPTDHREMLHPIVEFTGWGNIRVNGFEARADGALVSACWEIAPFTPGEPELLREP